MHVPDGFLSPPVWGGLGLAAVAGLALAVREANKGIQEHQVPLMGVTGAFVFAAQMINLPVGGGTSGHLVGAALLTALLGPHLAAVTLSCVVVVQALLFQDGGITALGANVFNMAIVGAYVSGGVLWLGRRFLPPFAAEFAAGWLSVAVGAALVAVQLGLSGTVPMGAALLAMVSVHAVIGLLEGAITVAVLRFLLRVRPDLSREARR